MYDSTTIANALNNQSKNFDFFRMIFERVKVIYFRGENYEKNLADKEFDEMFFEKTIDELSTVRKLFSDQILNQTDLIEFKAKTNPPMSNHLNIALNYFAIDTIVSAYKICFIEENKSSLEIEIFEKDKNNYLINMTKSLTRLEDIVSHSYADEMVIHFVKEAVEKTIQKEREPQRKGGKVKAEKEAKLYGPIRESMRERWKELWDQSDWSSKSRGKYTKFANHVITVYPEDRKYFDIIRNYISKYDQSKS